MGDRGSGAQGGRDHDHGGLGDLGLGGSSLLGLGHVDWDAVRALGGDGHAHGDGLAVELVDGTAFAADGTVERGEDRELLRSRFLVIPSRSKPSGEWSWLVMVVFFSVSEAQATAAVSLAA